MGNLVNLEVLDLLIAPILQHVVAAAAEQIVLAETEAQVVVVDLVATRQDLRVEQPQPAKDLLAAQLSHPTVILIQRVEVVVLAMWDKPHLIQLHQVLAVLVNKFVLAIMVISSMQAAVVVALTAAELRVLVVQVVVAQEQKIL
jgi:hypothetical protein